MEHEMDTDQAETRIIDREVCPDSWLCIDCGFDTGPGMLTRAKLQQAFAVAEEGRPVATFRINNKSEVYTVHDKVWQAAGMEPFGGCLCIGCLERRLCRELDPWDFKIGGGFNNSPGTPRLLKRRGV
jgi:hypothetical protein